jgi:hydroxymethylbilane synthase
MRAHPGLEIKLDVIRTTGDKVLDSPLHKMLDKGLFTKEIEKALLDGSVDIAVHSLKDLPTETAPGLTLGAISKREDPADALVAKGGRKLKDLSQGALVFTSSLRRRAQLLMRRPDLDVAHIRGNVDTRLRKFDDSAAEAIVFAAAGLVRLGFDGRITQRLDPREFLPACGQGALAIEIREGDAEAAEIVKTLDDCESRVAVTAERAFLERLQGGCQAPVGAYGEIVEDNQLRLTGIVMNLDGARFMKRSETAALGGERAPRALGLRLANVLLDEGCGEILEEARGASGLPGETGK